jgi:hypothetical protein
VQPFPSLQSALTQHAAHRPPPQSRSPEGQPHAPPAQICVAEHVVPHVPQFVALVARFTSQPSVTLPLQSAKPTSHVKPHVPALHVAVAFATTGHVVEHDPQCIGSAPRSAQTASQRVWPLAHITLHVPMSQTGDVDGHVTPHAPQLFGSLLETVHPLEPEAHWSHPVSQPHTPAVQCAFTPHAVAHAPQCVGSLRVSVSHPFVGSPSQSAKPV